VGGVLIGRQAMHMIGKRILLAGLVGLCLIGGAGWTGAACAEPVTLRLHRHPSYDETHIICEGHYDCQLGEQMLKLGPGDMMFVPKGTPHSVKSIGPETGRELIISSPGGIFDAFIDEVVTSMTNSGSPTRSGPATDFRAIAAKYGIEFLG
jgi:mannose-6-phosphate isomerase-like protein (cupin superfamily)